MGGLQIDLSDAAQSIYAPPMTKNGSIFFDFALCLDVFPGRESGFLYRPRHIFPEMTLKNTLRQKIIYPVPLGFVKKQKYYPKQLREGQLNRRR